MTEKTGKFISGISLGAICLIINFSSPVVALTLNYIMEAPGHFASGLVGEMGEKFSAMGLGWEILAIIPFLIIGLALLVVALALTAVLWILKTAAVTKTLGIVGFVVGYKLSIPPASAVEGLFVGLKNGIRRVALVSRDVFVEVVLIPVSKLVVKPRDTETPRVAIGGSQMSSGKDGLERRGGDSQVPEVRGDRAAREMRRIDDAASSWIKKIQYVHEQKRKKDLLVVRRDVEEEEIRRIQTATERLKAVEEFVRTGRRTQEVEQLLDREFKIKEADDNVALADADARLSEALLRKAKADYEIRQLGKPKAAKADADTAKLDAAINRIKKLKTGPITLLTKMLEENEQKAAQGDVTAQFMASELRRLFDDLMTGEF